MGQTSMMRTFVGHLRATARKPESHEQAQASILAVESGMCEAAVHALAVDRAGSELASKTVQRAGCVVIWWLCLPRSCVGWERREACITRVVDDGAIATLIAALATFPDD